MTKWMTKEEYKINFLYAFPSYRCLLRELDSKERVMDAISALLKQVQKATSQPVDVIEVTEAVDTSDVIEVEDFTDASEVIDIEASDTEE